MKRREFITLLGGSAVAWPLAADAQSRLGLLGGASPTAAGFPNRIRWAALGSARPRLFESVNLVNEYRWAGGNFTRLAGLVTDDWNLVQVVKRSAAATA